MLSSSDKIQSSVDHLPEPGRGQTAVCGDADLIVTAGPHDILQKALRPIGKGILGEIRSRRGRVDKIQALRRLRQAADLEPQVLICPGKGQLVPVANLEPSGLSQHIAEHDLPAALWQAARHHVWGIDGKILRDGVELEGHVAVIPLLGVHHHPGLHPGDAVHARQDPTVAGIQICTGEPVVRHILALQILAGDALQIVQDSAQSGVNHHRNQSDDTDGNQT